MHPNDTPEQLLRFVRASRSDGEPHQVIVRGSDLRPMSCNCRAGQYGRLCHAVISVTAEELLPIARTRWEQACGETEIRKAARVYHQVKRWARAAQELQALRTCEYLPVRQRSVEADEASSDLAHYFATGTGTYGHAAALVSA